jgi:hypothetical protein
MKLINIIYLFIILAPVLVVSCSKDEAGSPDLKYIKVGEALSSASAFNVQFYAKDSLFVGYNKVFFKVTDVSSGQPVTQASIILHPLMDMVTFSHACPVENPGENSNADGFFEGAVLFSMPGMDNSWSLAVDIDVSGKTGTSQFPISSVTATTPGKKIVVIDSLSNGQGSWIITKHPVSIVEPSEWKVGNNQFEITVHTMQSMMSFPCCDLMTVEITPEMPSMGHGSPNNVNPVSTGNGHYAGTVNFTMTGAWRVNMVFRKGDRVIGRNAYFDIVF